MRTVVDAERENQVSAENQFDRRFNASPTIEDDVLVLRSIANAHRIDGTTVSQLPNQITVGGFNMRRYRLLPLPIGANRRQEGTMPDVD